MQSQGFELLGSGMHATVWHNLKHPYVVKIFENDSNYEEFIKLAISNPSPFFPKFYKKIVSIPNTTFKAIRIERLEPIRSSLLEKYQSMIAYLIYNFDYKMNSIDREELLEFADIPEDQIYDLSLDVPADQKKVCDLLAQIVSPPSKLDLHMGNLMHRNQQLVFVDPIN